MSTSHPVSRNIKNNWSANGNITLGKLNYRRALCCLQIQNLILQTFSSNCVHSVSYFASQTNWGNEIWYTSWLETLSVLIKSFTVRSTYDEFRSSTKISQGPSQTLTNVESSQRKNNWIHCTQVTTSKKLNTYAIIMITLVKYFTAKWYFLHTTHNTNTLKLQHCPLLYNAQHTKQQQQHKV